MKNGLKNLNGENNVSSFGSTGSAIRYYRTKKGTSQIAFAEDLNNRLKSIKLTEIPAEFKKAYNEVKEKTITQQLVSEWEAGKNVPEFFIYLIATSLNVGTEWLTKYSYDLMEGGSFTQHGGVCYNNFHNNYINNNPEAIAAAYNDCLNRVEAMYEKFYNNRKDG